MLSGSDTVAFAWHVLVGFVRLSRGLLSPLGAAGNLTSDAHLAALAIEHGAELCSTDVDFSRFSGVQWIDPLQP